MSLGQELIGNRCGTTQNIGPAAQIGQFLGAVARASAREIHTYSKTGLDRPGGGQFSVPPKAASVRVIGHNAKPIFVRAAKNAVWAALVQLPS